MTNRYKIIFLLLIIVVLWKGFQILLVFPNENSSTLSDELNGSRRIKVSVYYEALCSDSRNFIIKQLEPTYNELNNYIDLDLIPYGKAKTIEEKHEINFTCQHGPTECLANKVHACVLDYVLEPLAQLKYVSCMIGDNMLPREIAKKCALELNVPYDGITNCYNGNKGSVLLKEYGIRTLAVSPSITFIPTVELDGSQKVPLGWVLKNLKKEVCNMFSIKPKECL